MDAGPAPRVVLVETSEALPGLLPFQAWDALAIADEVLVRDPDAHPSAGTLHAAGLDLVELRPATLERSDLDLSRPGSPGDRRLAKSLLARALDGRTPVMLLGPEDEGVATALAGMTADHDVEIEIVFFAPQPPGTELLELVEVMARLRDPERGCPWDLEQDHRSLLRYLVEETYELVDAIEQGHDADLAEELGDVLLQVVFHAQLARDRGAFGIDDVARGITEKLVHRHPHVFGDVEVESAADVKANWETLKDAEKSRSGVFDGIPASLPGLLLLDKVLHRAVTHDGRWQVDDPASRVRAALAALEEDGPSADGDRDVPLEEIVLSVVALARALGADAEAAARSAAARLRSRVEGPAADPGV